MQKYVLKQKSQKFTIWLQEKFYFGVKSCEIITHWITQTADTELLVKTLFVIRRWEKHFSFFLF